MKYILLIFLIIKTLVLPAQDWDNINIAKEYVENKEYNKAKDTYDKFLKKDFNIKDIYSDYKKLLVLTKQYNEAEKLITKAIKLYPQNVIYKVDYYLLLKIIPRSEKQISKERILLYKFLEKNISQINISAAYLNKETQYEEALKIYKFGRDIQSNQFLYVEEIVDIYKSLQQHEMYINEILTQIEKAPQQTDKFLKILQSYLESEIEFQYFEKTLYQYIQKYPNQIAYNEMLYWMYVQNKKFSLALIQAKAIDKQNQSDGLLLLELGKLAFDNKYYEDAIKIYQTAYQDTKGNQNKYFAKQQIIISKEELIKSKYPVNKIDILSLCKEYENISIEQKNTSLSEIYRKWAILKGFYLNDTDSSIILLNKAIVQSYNDFYQRDKCKLDLADMYLLKDEPWEAILLYYQVEKSQKEQKLGYEAKLKNAKASYYKGEFGLATEHLDVLKLATTREIANDAMYLSLLIRDNLQEDTLGIALKSFSMVGLLEFRQQYQQAIDTLQLMIKKYNNHTITDDLYYALGKIQYKIRSFQEAINQLEVFVSKYPEEILADDAIYLMAKIYEEELKNTEKAMEHYQIIVSKYGFSIYADESKLKYRKLRGDKI
jgi:tetratricopeptide (TPR) repeat protein